MQGASRGCGSCRRPPCTRPLKPFEAEVDFVERVFATHIKDRALPHGHADPLPPRCASPKQLQRQNALADAAVSAEQRTSWAGIQSGTSHCRAGAGLSNNVAAVTVTSFGSGFGGFGGSGGTGPGGSSRSPVFLWSWTSRPNCFPWHSATSRLVRLLLHFRSPSIASHSAR